MSSKPKEAIKRSNFNSNQDIVVIPAMPLVSADYLKKERWQILAEKGKQYQDHKQK